VRLFATGANESMNGRVAGSARLTLLKAMLAGVVASLALTLGATQANAATGPIEVSEVLSGSVRVATTVDTEGAVSYIAFNLFEYPNTTSTVQQIVAEVPPSSEPVVVTRVFSGLKASTKYTANLTEGGGFGPSVEFTTLPASPPVAVSVDPPTEIANTAATVAGTVERPAGADPNFDPICKVNYITDAAFGETRNARQQLRVSEATGGTFSLAYGSQTTGQIPFDATMSEIATALEAVPAIGSGAVAVTEEEPGVFQIEFIGPLAAQSVLQLSPSSANLVPLGQASATTQFIAQGRPEGFEGAQVVPCAPGRVPTVGVSPVTARLTGLVPNTVYHYELEVTNSGGTDTLVAATTFTSDATPVARTLGLDAVAADTARLGGSLNPANGGPVTYGFEWGPTESYGRSVPLTPATLGFSDNTFHTISVPLAGLAPSTEYHYRLVATNTSSGKVGRGIDRVFTTRAAGGEVSCPNAAFRVGPSAGLPDCRAYEWVTPGLNNTNTINSAQEIFAQPDGSAIHYYTFDAPVDAQSATINQPVVSRRGSGGWTTKSLGALSPQPSEGFAATAAEGLVSPDLTESLFYSTAPLTGTEIRGQLNLYLRRADDSITRISTAGIPIQAELQYQYNIFQARSSADWSHIFWNSVAPQTADSPTGVNNAFEWSQAGGVKPVGVLPAEGSTPEGPAPGGATLAQGSLPASSSDGRLVLFSPRSAPSTLYLRIDGQETVEVSASQKAVPDPGPSRGMNPIGISPDGSTVLFISYAELTDDANTGETEGVPNEKGADLYSYDVASGVLTDLTPDDNPEDAGAGAHVLALLDERHPEAGNPLPYASADASTVYFVAMGNLAPGAESGRPNLYVVRGGHIRFVASASGFMPFGYSKGLYATPDGDYMTFVSTENLTGYDSGGQAEIYRYSYPTNSLECASCRPDGSVATGGATFERRGISDDGSRVFFTSEDAVLPGLSNGLARVYEFAGGKVSLLSPATATKPATMVDAGGSGDVFMTTYEELVPGAGRTFAVYDAHVNGTPSQPTADNCQGEGCRGPGSQASSGSSAGSTKGGPGNEVSVPKSKSATSAKVKVRLGIPEAGRLIVSGQGIRSIKKKVAGAGSVMLTVALTKSANQKRVKKGVYKTKAEVQFTPDGGSSPGTPQTSVLKLTFRAGKKGGK
jgi:hypothetical protein